MLQFCQQKQWQSWKLTCWESFVNCLGSALAMTMTWMGFVRGDVWGFCCNKLPSVVTVVAVDSMVVVL